MAKKKKRESKGKSIKTGILMGIRGGKKAVKATKKAWKESESQKQREKRVKSAPKRKTYKIGSSSAPKGKGFPKHKPVKRNKQPNIIRKSNIYKGKHTGEESGKW
jgi:hypothetical protein